MEAPKNTGLVIVEETPKMLRLDKDLRIHKSNDLIEASYKLSTQEMRLILIMIAMLNPYEEKQFYRMRLTVQEFGDLVELSGKGLYDEIENITKSLIQKTLTIRKPNSNLVISWLSSAEYFEGKGYIELEFSSKLAPYLLHLQGLYTPYSLREVLKLRHAYAVRIYELCVQYLRIGERYLTITEIKEILGLDDGQYAMYADLKRRIFNPSIKDINKNTKLSVKFEEKKESRRVVGIKFIFFRKDAKGEKTIIPAETNPELFNRLTKYFCLSQQQANNVMELYPEGRLQANLRYVERRFKAGHVENIGAYTWKCIQENISDAISLFREEEKDLEHDRARKVAEDALEREYYEMRDSTVAAYSQQLPEEELNAIKEGIQRRYQEEYSGLLGVDVLIMVEYKKEMASRAGLPSLEEWLAEKKMKI